MTNVLKMPSHTAKERHHEEELVPMVPSDVPAYRQPLPHIWEAEPCLLTDINHVFQIRNKECVISNLNYIAYSGGGMLY